MWPFRKKHVPPSARQVAERAVVLQGVIAYVAAAPTPEFLAMVASGWSAQDYNAFCTKAEELRGALTASLGASRASLSGREKTLFATPLDALSQQQRIDASWRLESLGTLSWALGTQAVLGTFDAESEGPGLRLIPANTAGFVASASLRPRKEIDDARDLAEFWHWRSRTRQLIEEGRVLEPDQRPPGVETYDDIVRLTARQLGDNGPVKVMNGDFEVRGKAYRDLTDDEWAKIRSITMEKHLALNWLCGRAPYNDWDETPTDT